MRRIAQKSVYGKRNVSGIGRQLVEGGLDVKVELLRLALKRELKIEDVKSAERAAA